MTTVGARLSLEAVTREMGGLYQCLATNGVEDQDTEIYAVIRLTVHCTDLITTFIALKYGPDISSFKLETCCQISLI